MLVVLVFDHLGNPSQRLQSDLFRRPSVQPNVSSCIVVDALLDDLLFKSIEVLQFIDKVVVYDDHVFLHLWIVFSALVDLDKVELILVSEG